MTAAAVQRDPFGDAGAAGTEQGYPQPQFFDSELYPVVSTGNWLGTMLLLFIVPVILACVAGVVSALVGADNIVAIILNIIAILSSFIMVLIFAFGKRFNPSKRNFFKAYLIMFLIMLVILVVMGIVIFTTFAGFLPEIMEEYSTMFMTY